jgi:hypothetical protein
MPRGPTASPTRCYQWYCMAPITPCAARKLENTRSSAGGRDANRPIVHRRAARWAVGDDSARRSPHRPPPRAVDRAVDDVYEPQSPDRLPPGRRVGDWRRRVPGLHGLRIVGGGRSPRCAPVAPKSEKTRSSQFVVRALLQFARLTTCKVLNPEIAPPAPADSAYSPPHPPPPAVRSSIIPSSGSSQNSGAETIGNRVS